MELPLRGFITKSGRIPNGYIASHSRFHNSFIPLLFLPSENKDFYIPADYGCVAFPGLHKILPAWIRIK
jgi:hypothetical protein